MHSRVLNYLNKKNPTNYTQLDKILSFYANKKLEEVLLNMGVTKIEFFPSINKKMVIQSKFISNIIIYQLF